MTHKEIARLANVSVSTVSKALAGSREVSDETAELIMRIAMEAGYIKEKNTRKTKNRKKHEASIAVFCPEIVSIYYSGMVTAVRKYVHERGGRVSVHIYDFNPDKLKEDINDIAVRGEADGIIIMDGGNYEVAPQLPTVFIGNCADGKYDCIYNNSADIINTVTEYLMSMGHKKIGYVGELLTIDKYIDFRKSIHAHCLEFREEWCYTIDRRFEEIGYEAAERIARAEEVPTAFVCAYDEVALALIHGLEKHGISVPEDISVVGINDIPFSAYAAKPLTTVNLFDEERCRIGVDMLFDRMFGNAGTVKRIKARHETVVRETVRDLKE